MAIAKAGTSVKGEVASGSSLSISFTVTSGNDRILIVRGSRFVAGSGSISSVTYGGAPLTNLASVEFPDLGGDYGAEFWYLLNPSVGTANVVVTPNATGHDLTFGVDQWNGVHQSTPFGTPVTATGINTSTQPSVTVASATGEMVLGVCAPYFPDTFTITPGAGTTQDWEEENDASNPSAAAASADGASSVTLQWTLNRASGIYWGVIGAAMKPAGAGGGAAVRSNLALLGVGR